MPEDSAALNRKEGELATPSPVQLANLALRTSPDAGVAGQTVVEKTDVGQTVAGKTVPGKTVAAKTVSGKTSVAEFEGGRGLPGVTAGAELRRTSVREANDEEEPASQTTPTETTGLASGQNEQAPIAIIDASPVRKMDPTPAVPEAERGTRQKSGRTAGKASDDPAPDGAGDAPSDGPKSEQFPAIPAPVLNPLIADAKPAGDATDPARENQSPRELLAVPTAPAPAPLSLSASTDSAIPASATPATVERAFSSSEPTDPVDRNIGKSQPVQPSRRSSGSVVTELLALSGQIARPVESIPPVRPARVPSSPVESSIPDTDPQVRALAAGTADRGEVAFAMQVQAMPPREDPLPGEPLGKMQEIGKSRRIPITTELGDVPVAKPPATSEVHPSLYSEPDVAPVRAGRERHPDEALPERPETPAGTAVAKLIPHAVPDTQTKDTTTLERPDATTVKPVRPQDAMESVSKPETVGTTPLRDMKFEVTGGESRVEVRLSERAGEVKMTVRTPDANLASTLRENLPVLSNRLAESGYKSEAWHPAASSTNEWRHTAQSSAGSASQDANSQSREQKGESQDGSRQRRPRIPEEPATPKQKGKDFAWLMSSLR
jgi:hypothetical protein